MIASCLCAPKVYNFLISKNWTIVITCAMMFSALSGIFVMQGVSQKNCTIYRASMIILVGVMINIVCLMAKLMTVFPREAEEVGVVKR